MASFNVTWLLSLIKQLVAWKREKREQRAAETAKEKDRPRFRVDPTIVPTNHAAVPQVIVKVLSLGSLPLRINQGEAFIEASHYPERVQAQDFSNREIGPVHPIELKFSLPPKLIHPERVGEVTVKLICQFSYADGKGYRSEHQYKGNQFEFVKENYY